MKSDTLLQSEGIVGKSRRAPPLLGKTPEICRLRAIVEKAACVDSIVLILGESGSGKEVVARTIHRLSNRADQPWVAINCGAIPSDLLASELFGHERGAFTGAVVRHKGCFERAGSGTLMLDEIGEMSPEMQVKLLRVLEERSFERLGGQGEPILVQARIVAATNQNLKEQVAAGRFRADLYYRLDVVSIAVPSLRERSQDIDQLIDASCMHFAARGFVLPRISESARTLMRTYCWPGNIRQLFNIVERLCVLYPGEPVGPHQLPPEIRQARSSEHMSEPLRPNFASLPSELGNGFKLKAYMEEVETDLIDLAMSEAAGVVAEAARLLGIRRTTLVEKLRRRQRMEETLQPSRDSGSG